MLQSHRSVRPTTVADLHRLADLAHARGLRVFEPAQNHWFCTSHSDPFALHVVTGFSCDCAGFLHVGRCTHHALLLEHLGWLPELPDDELSAIAETLAPASCPNCSGGGVVHYRSDTEERCPECGGTGIKPDRRLAGQPAVDIVAHAA
jgi:hypothetical protein